MPQQHESLLKMRDVCSRTGLSRATIYRLLAREDFPKPVTLAVQCVRWPASAVDTWINTKIGAAKP